MSLGRQRQVDLYAFEASLVYKASSRTARTVTQSNLVSGKRKKVNNKVTIDRWSLLLDLHTIQSLIWHRFNNKMTALSILLNAA